MPRTKMRRVAIKIAPVSKALSYGGYDQITDSLNPPGPDPRCAADLSYKRVSVL